MTLLLKTISTQLLLYRPHPRSQWRDYSKLEIVRGDALCSYSARLLNFNRQPAKIGKPADKAEAGS
jgi:predicted metalloendopeptidase